jgi:hypothetical protein
MTSRAQSAVTGSADAVVAVSQSVIDIDNVAANGIVDGSDYIVQYVTVNKGIFAPTEVGGSYNSGINSPIDGATRSDSRIGCADKSDVKDVRIKVSRSQSRRCRIVAHVTFCIGRIVVGGQSG